MNSNNLTRFFFKKNEEQHEPNVILSFLKHLTFGGCFQNRMSGANQGEIMLLSKNLCDEEKTFILGLTFLRDRDRGRQPYASDCLFIFLLPAAILLLCLIFLFVHSCFAV